MRRLVDRRRPGRIAACLPVILWTAACAGSPAQDVLTVDLPLHLDEHLDAATVTGSEVPADVPQPVEWRFDEPQPGWTATPPRPFPGEILPATVSQTDEALRITLGPSNADPYGRLRGGVHVDVPAWNHTVPGRDQRDLEYVAVRVRSSGPGDISLGFNVWDQEGDPVEGSPYPFENGVLERGFADVVRGRNIRLVGDNTVQTYHLWPGSGQPPEVPIEQLGLWIRADNPLTVEILSIRVGLRDALYAEERAGVSQVRRFVLERNSYRPQRSLFVHTPAQLAYRVQVPADARLDTDFGTVGPGIALWDGKRTAQREDGYEGPELPTTFRVTVQAEGEPAETLLEARHADPETWAEHSIDLGAYAGQVVTLSLEAESDRDGSVALWGAPTLTAGETGFLTRTVTVDGVEWPYKVYVPRAYQASEKWPVILHLYATTDGAFARAIRSRLGRWPTIAVFAPRWPGDQEDEARWRWRARERVALAALDATFEEFAGDESRVYLTGSSIGGRGTWHLGFRYPERFAALVPVACYGPHPGSVGPTTGRWTQETLDEFYVEFAEWLVGIPIWIFHGDADTWVSVENAREMAAALEAAGADVRYTEYPGVGHNPDYVSDELLAWLLAQRKSEVVR